MAETIALHVTAEYSTLVSTWRDVLYLTRRANGTFTLKLHRQPIGDPGYAYLYRSAPFRTAHALLSAIKAAEPQSAFESFDEDEISDMLTEAESLAPELVADARTLLAQRLWDRWNSDEPEAQDVRPSAWDNSVK
jgi:hypothetical protein